MPMRAAMAQPRPRKGWRRAPTSLPTRPKRIGATRAVIEEKGDDGFDDEDDGGGVPVRVEGEEGADAVVVGVVEEDVAEERDEGEEIEAGPVDWGGRA